MKVIAEFVPLFNPRKVLSKLKSITHDLDSPELDRAARNLQVRSMLPIAGDPRWPYDVGLEGSRSMKPTEVYPHHVRAFPNSRLARWWAVASVLTNGSVFGAIP